MTYTFAKWLLFLYIYCFIGWIWECLYVSVCKGKWVNRGFMAGPFLPIYGCGAIMILFLTLPVRESAVAVYFIGMVSATILEYFTGAAMEKLFHVRYWDYSKNKLNVNGHICLKSSLAWGAFSVVLTLYGHKPLERLVMGMNQNVLEFIVFGLTAVIAVDFSQSVREALDLKELLITLENNHEELRRIQKRIDVIKTVYGTEVKEKSEQGLKKLNLMIESGKELWGKKEYIRVKKLLKRNPGAVSMRHAQALRDLLNIHELSSIKKLPKKILWRKRK